MLRKPSKPIQSNAAIQKLLDVQSERKRSTSWSEADVDDEDWGAAPPKNQSDEDPGEGREEGDAEWTKDAVLDPNLGSLGNFYGQKPRYAVIFKGAMMSLTERFRANLDLIMSLKLYPKNSTVPERPLEAWQINENEVLVSFTPEGYAEIVGVRVLRLGPAAYHIIPIRVTANALVVRLATMEYADEIDVGEDDPRDPLVAASLVPGLRRSEYTQAINKQMYYGYCNQYKDPNAFKGLEDILTRYKS